MTGESANGNGVPAAAGDNGPLIDVRGLTKVFDHKTVVDRLDMRVGRGEIFGFLGPNGSGKTTFIRMLCGLLRPDGGSGTCLGFDLMTEAWRIKSRVGYMSQKFSLYTDLTVRENLDFIARTYRIADRKKTVDEAIERMQLGRFTRQLAGNLSGGWKQRLALTACTLHQPRLLLLDEPTAGVDPSARRDFWDEIHALAARGITSLISTHYMDEAERCHRLAYIAYGTLLASGTVEELIAGSGLFTWEINGPSPSTLALGLQGREGIDQVVAFGTRLHVSGRDAALLERTIRNAVGPEYRCAPTATSLEEVFIDLMRGALS